MNYRHIIIAIACSLLVTMPVYGQTSVIKRNTAQQTVSKKPAVRWTDKAYSYSEGLCWVKDNNGKYGYIDEKGKLVIPCKWRDARYFSEGLARVKNDNERWGFIDKTGGVVIEFRWEQTGDFHQGQAGVKGDNGKWGFIDKTGTLTIPYKWDTPAAHGPEFNNDGLAIVNGKYEINKSGDVVKVVSFPTCWGCDSVLLEGLVQVKGPEGKYGYVDKDKKVVIPFKYHSAFSFHEGMAIVKNETNKFGFIDKTGQEIIPCKYSYVENFSEGMAIVHKEQYKVGVIDKKGNEIVPCNLKNASSFKEGLAYVDGGKDFRGYINYKGELVIKAKGWYSVSCHFSEGLASVSSIDNKLEGYIDKTGKIVIPCKWKRTHDFHDGLAKVYNESYHPFFIDRTGKVVIDATRWKKIGEFSEGLCWVLDENQKLGFIDKSGAIAIPCIFQQDYILLKNYSFKNGKVRVKDENGRIVYIDKNGNVVK